MGRQWGRRQDKRPLTVNITEEAHQKLGTHCSVVGVGKAEMVDYLIRYHCSSFVIGFREEQDQPKQD